MIGDESFRMQRRDKLMMTLRVDEKEKHAYYYTLAYALAMLNHDSEMLFCMAQALQKCVTFAAAGRRTAALGNCRISRWRRFWMNW